MTHLPVFNKGRDKQGIKAILVLIFLSALVGWLISSGFLDIQMILIIIGAVLLGIFILSNRQVHRNILLAAYVGLIVGWRSIPFFSYNIYIYPVELLIWIGFVATLANVKNTQFIHQLPRSALWLAGFALLGMVFAFLRGNSMVGAVDEFKTFIIFIPVIILLQKSVNSITDVTRCVVVLVITAFLIAASGVLEYYFPAISNFAASLSAISSGEYLRYNYNSGAWIRLSPFYLWGIPVVAVVLVPAIGWWSAIFVQAAGWKKWLWAYVGSVLAAGILVSGYRSAWLGLLVAAIIMLFLTRKSAVFFWAIIGAFITLLPLAFIDRFKSILNVSQTSDGSLILRSARLSEGVQGIFQHPLWGAGWGSTAMFNDWLYIAVALGLPAFIVFVYWYGRLIVQLNGVLRWASQKGSYQERHLAAGFIIGLLGYAVCMLSGAMSQVRPLMTTFWLMFCLALRFVELTEIEKSEKQELQIG